MHAHHALIDDIVFIVHSALSTRVDWPDPRIDFGESYRLVCMLATVIEQV